MNLVKKIVEYRCEQIPLEEYLKIFSERQGVEPGDGDYDAPALIKNLNFKWNEKENSITIFFEGPLGDYQALILTYIEDENILHNVEEYFKVEGPVINPVGNSETFATKDGEEYYLYHLDTFLIDLANYCAGNWDQ